MPQAASKVKETCVVTIFPNPAVNQLKVLSKKEKEILTITITDLAGRTILKQTLETSNFIATLELELLTGLILLPLAMLTIKRLLKNCSLQNKQHKKKWHRTILCLLLFYAFSLPAQITNYINNGGFEEAITNTSTPWFYTPKYWGATDSVKPFGELLSSIVAPIKVPLNSYTY